MPGNHIKEQPTLYTKQLVLRPLNINDASDVQRLAGVKEIASVTVLIPYPYEIKMAKAWIESHQGLFKNGRHAIFAITHKEQGYMIGVISLGINQEHQWADMGYWIGVDYWKQGYCTEAAIRILEYGFNDLNLNRIKASHFKRNPASGRVMEKIGMKYEGCQREQIKKWGRFEDSVLYGILKKEL